MPNPKNKKFIAQREREERQKRYIMIGTIAVLTIVIGLVVYGLVTENVFKPNKPVLELRSHSISSSEFKQRVRYQRLNMVNQAIQMYQYGMTDYVTQIATQLQSDLVGQQTIETLKDEMIILLEAEEQGIELSKDELEQEIQYLFGYYAEGTPTPAPTQEIAPTSTLTSQQLTLVPKPETPTEGEEGEEGEEAPTSTPTVKVEEETSNDPTATPILKPTEYTYEVYLENYNKTLENLSLEINMEEETLREIIKAYILRQKLMESVSADIGETQEHLWARHILVADEETAQEVLAKLNEGSNFAELALEYSTGPSAQTGGDLGWFTKDAMVAPFADAAYALEVGEISDPVQTSFGWHIIQTLGREERTLDQATLEQKRTTAFETWLAEKRVEYADEFVIDESWSNDVPTDPALPPELLQALSQEQQQQQLPVAPSEGEGNE
ncbi:MAG: Foldase protein PrsA [Chloroflexi bacterium]|nr:Foldase protein PrsA [Chloroflexota bacterium]